MPSSSMSPSDREASHPPMIFSLLRQRSGKSLSLDLCLVQPVRHAHLAVHRRRGGEVLLRLLALARPPGELAEAEVAVGDEGAHAEFLCASYRLHIGRFGALDIRRILTRADFTQEPHRPGFGAMLAPLSGQFTRLASGLACFVDPPDRQIGFATLSKQQRVPP